MLLTRSTLSLMLSANSWRVSSNADRSISHAGREPTAVSRETKASMILERSMSVSITSFICTKILLKKRNTSNSCKNNLQYSCFVVSLR